MLWSDVELRGIPAYAALLPVVLLHKFDEMGEDGIRTGLWLVVVLYPIDDIAQVVEHCQ